MKSTGYIITRHNQTTGKIISKHSPVVATIFVGKPSLFISSIGNLFSTGLGIIHAKGLLSSISNSSSTSSANIISVSPSLSSNYSCFSTGSASINAKGVLLSIGNCISSSNTSISGLGDNILMSTGSAVSIGSGSIKAKGILVSTNNLFSTGLSTIIGKASIASIGNSSSTSLGNISAKGALLSNNSCVSTGTSSLKGIGILNSNASCVATGTATISSSSSGGSTSYDTDAQAFFTAVEGGGDTLTSTQKGAVNQLVLNFKSAGIWVKMKAIYLFIGGTSTAHRWNLRDPRDLDAAYRLLFVGSPTHDANGVSYNGSSQYANTFFTPSSLDASDLHMSVYMKNAIATTSNLAFIGAATDNYTIIGCYNNGGANIYANLNNQLFNNLANITTDGLILGTTNSAGANNQQLYKNGSLAAQNSVSLGVPPPPSTNIFIGAFNSNGSASQFTANTYEFASIGNSLTSTEAAAMYTAIQTFETSNVRQA